MTRNDSRGLTATIVDAVRRLRELRRLPASVHAAIRNDRRRDLSTDAGADAVVRGGVAWLKRAQDHNALGDGGVARDFSLLHGWAASYPETTGYIIPTLLEFGTRYGDEDCLRRARRAVDWLCSIQLPSGGFQGGRIDQQPIQPVVFNTGQILIGLASAVKTLAMDSRSLQRSADWLVEAQDSDGAWRKHRSPFAVRGAKAYETHVAWGLMETARVTGDASYGAAALANVDWALRSQQDNGWFDNCCLSTDTHPLTHTIGYALRGVVEAYRYSGNEVYLVAAERTARALITTMQDDGRIPGRLDRNWEPRVNWACLTGSAQIACCWFILHGLTGTEAYLTAACKANEFIRRTIDLRSDQVGSRGAIKGSHPIDGGYCPLEYPSWATKFTVDANMLELAAGVNVGITDAGVQTG